MPPPFDPPNFPYEPPRPPPSRCQRTNDPALFTCGICDRLRFDPYLLAEEKRGVRLPANCGFKSCGYCGDGLIVVEGGRPERQHFRPGRIRRPRPCLGPVGVVLHQDRRQILRPRPADRLGGWQHALWPDAAVHWDAAADAARSGNAPLSLSGQRTFYLCMLVGGLLVAVGCGDGLRELWALHVTRKAPALLRARIEQLEAANGKLSEDYFRMRECLIGATENLKELEEFHDTAGFERLAAVLRFPGIRAAVLAALHPDRAKNDNERKTLTERFQTAAAVFDDLAEG